MRILKRAFILMPLTLIACSEASDKEDGANFGELRTTVGTNPETQTYNLTKATCTNNKSSGLLTAVFTGDKQSRVELKIKGFSSSKNAYTCLQSPENRDGDVDEGFVECMAEFDIPDPTKGVNTYSMMRNSDSLGAFTYGKACSISTQYTAPKLSFTVLCSDLIQTHLYSAVRNPISADETASLVTGSTFSCNI